MSDDERLPLYEEVAARLLIDPMGRHQWREVEPGPPPSPQPRERVVASELENVRLIESRDPRLRRHVVHDRRSRQYALPAASVPRKQIAWPRRGPVLDQGEVGSCTANAAVGLLMTVPFDRGRQFTEADAQQLYREETHLDDREIPGHWEPDDTGSAGIYAMKALKARGWIKSYHHAFSVSAALAALVNGPIAVGSVWLNSMMEPARGTGVLTVDSRSGEDGGHEYVVDGWNPYTGMVRMTNSWSESWGHDGSAFIAYKDFAWLLAQQGDVVQPVIA